MVPMQDFIINHEKEIKNFFDDLANINPDEIQAHQLLTVSDDDYKEHLRYIYKQLLLYLPTIEKIFGKDSPVNCSARSDGEEEKDGEKKKTMTTTTTTTQGTTSLSQLPQIVPEEEYLPTKPENNHSALKELKFILAEISPPRDEQKKSRSAPNNKSKRLFRVGRRSTLIHLLRSRIRARRALAEQEQENNHQQDQNNHRTHTRHSYPSNPGGHIGVQPTPSLGAAEKN